MSPTGGKRVKVHMTSILASTDFYRGYLSPGVLQIRLQNVARKQCKRKAPMLLCGNQKALSSGCCLIRLEEAARKQREREAELEEKKRLEREAIIAGAARPSPAPSPEKPSEGPAGGGGYLPPTRRGGSGGAPHPHELSGSQLCCAA